MMSISIRDVFLFPSAIENVLGEFKERYTKQLQKDDLRVSEQFLLKKLEEGRSFLGIIFFKLA